ncbi:MAG: hypothetical protein KatS3mg007_1852 [Thermoanaerobaculum sp.]|nr:MAG: hypothetical protein KatS3mg007_1852 [Thermoanaerobaculum sp.]
MKENHSLSRLSPASARQVLLPGPGALSRRWAWLATLPLVLLLGTVACSQGPAEKAPPEETARTADRVQLTPEQAASARMAMAVVRREVPIQTLSLTGSIAYDETRTARVAPRVPGRVLRHLADLGQRVSAGDVLCILDSPELGEAQAAYLTKLTEYQVAERAYERAKELVAAKAISQAEFLEREGSFRKAEAELAYAENRLHLFDMSDPEIERLAAEASKSGASLHATVSPELVLRSPISGVVTRREVSPGQMVDRFQTLFVVSDLSWVWAWLDVFERDLAAVQVGSPLEVTAEAFPGETFSGEADFLGEVEPTTRTARVRVRIHNPKGLLRPGLFVRAVVRVPAGTPVLLVPREAVQDVGGRTVVFRAEGAASFAVVPVKVGRQLDGKVEILEGLAEGDQIAAAGAFALKGQLLKGQLGEEE